MKISSSYLYSLVFVALAWASYGQKKQVTNVRFGQKITIDGLLNEEDWDRAGRMTQFVEYEPSNGPAEPEHRRTVVKIGFDDQFFYVGAVLRDNHPDSILTQLTRRDNYNGNCDWFGFFLNPFNDGLHDFNFWVTAAGVQSDSRTTADGDDFDWNTIWYSAVQVHDSGWTVEMAIPYQSLRFSPENLESWAIQSFRYVRRSRQLYSWNFIDRGVGIPEQHSGLLTGMQGIKPPLRLAFLPYGSVYVQNYDQETSVDYNLGMDMKYGISESFTLDMTLVPDFGQVAFDQQFLNLSPFENQFQENRQFFTEGSDLFGKGGLFYSRRIGGAPRNITNAALTDTQFTQTTQGYTHLINATKVSGRTRGNLGIGVLNAITDNNFLEATDPLTGETQSLLTDPRTNYNVLVLDQRFGGNSSISLVNTNVLREGEYQDANATGLLLDWYTPGNEYNLVVNGYWSQVFEKNTATNGYSTSWSLEKTSGQWRWEVGQELQTNTYRINDLGFQPRNNLLNHYAGIFFQNVQPLGPFNRLRSNVYLYTNHLHNKGLLESVSLSSNTFVMTRNFFAMGLDLSATPWGETDYFEPRQAGRSLNVPAQYYGNFWFSSDYRNPFALDGGLYGSPKNAWGSYSYGGYIKPVVRVSDAFSFEWRTNVGQGINMVGWADSKPDSILFAYRDQLEVTNTLTAKYIFTPNSSFSLDFRHLWTRLKAKNLSELTPSGDLGIRFVPTSNAYDLQFSAFNIDCKFSWWFAPGSELILLYRNGLLQGGNELDPSYINHLDRLFRTPQSHNLSLRLVYFLDVHYLSRKWRRP